MRRSLELNPNQADAGNWLSTQLSGSSQHDESLSLLERVVERDPLYRPAFNNLIFTYMQTRDFDKASSLVSRVERITGDSPSVRLARGSLAVMEGRLASALEDLRFAYEFNPSSSVASSNYGLALLLLGDYDGAAEVSYLTDKLVPLELSGRHGEATALFQVLQEREPDSYTLRAIGDWLLLQERAAEFVEIVEQSAGDSEDWIEAQVAEQQLYGVPLFTNLAYALRRIDSNGEADRFLARAAEMLAEQERHGADNFYYWINVGEYAALTGDVSRVFSSLQRAIDAGYVAYPGFYTAILNPYRGDPRFIELENAVIRKAEEERRKLGMLATTG